MQRNLTLFAAVFSLTGCAAPDALFVGTYTRLGIDASQSGAGGGIGFKNVAITVAPTKTTGEAYDILGTTDVDLAFDKLALVETVATGEAAVCASGKSTVADLAKKLEETERKSRGPLIFLADTSWSLIEVSMGEAAGPGISFGYRRTVGIRMPIKNENIGSVYASVSISTLDTDHANTAKKTEVDGIRSVYTFATGAASVKMAQRYATDIAGNPLQSGCQN